MCNFVQVFFGKQIVLELLGRRKRVTVACMLFFQNRTTIIECAVPTGSNSPLNLMPVVIPTQIVSVHFMLVNYPFMILPKQRANSKQNQLNELLRWYTLLPR